jgi:hypothetical protein
MPPAGSPGNTGEPTFLLHALNARERADRYHEVQEETREGVYNLCPMPLIPHLFTGAADAF